MNKRGRPAWWTESRYDELERRFWAGASVEELAVLFNRSPAVIRQRMGMLDLRLRDRQALNIRPAETVLRAF